MKLLNREFIIQPAKRERVPLLIGLMGPSGGGKTYSALRLATGMQRVAPGPIVVIDTESRRAAHYADKFPFMHLPFAAPFSPLDYLAAIERAAQEKPAVTIIDSMSHEHEGPGGVLEAHDAEVERLSKGDVAKAERVSLLAWAKPKAERRRLINSLVQAGGNFIFCFRAKEKIKPQAGAPAVNGSLRGLQLGFMPIAGDEFLYEMTATVLLLPNADGVPTWNPENIGERTMVKVPAQFRTGTFPEAGPLDEKTGELLAKWAAGLPEWDPLGDYVAAQRVALEKIRTFLTERWPGTTDQDKKHKAAALEMFFGTRSWTAVTKKTESELLAGLEAMTCELAEQK